MAQRVIPEKDLGEVLEGLRNLRRMALKRSLDPFAFRQAMIIVLELDRVGALERGVKPGDLDSFDAKVRVDAKKWAKETMGL